jgi:tetratricopeptide (TPR) repeat protein
MFASSLRSVPRYAATALVLIATACGGGLREPSPADIPVLEEAVSQDPENTISRTQLGMAYYKADRFQDALSQLSLAVEAGSEEAATFLYLGLANEAMEDWAAARSAYTRYMEVGRSDPLRAELERRLVLIVRNELQSQARSAIAQEAELATAAPLPRSVAVFPFQLVSENDDLMPLQVAMADMMITDLSISNALTVLERTQIQSLLDEMAMTDAGYTDAASGARAGRLLQAEHVVQGALTTLGDDNLRFDANVLNTVQSSSAGSLSAQDLLEGLFDMEKEIVFQVIDVLGAQLTPAEREAINENRAENILAFLAYGRGLVALDNGDYAGAQQFFQQATDLDPEFSMADNKVTEAADLTDATSRTTADVATAGAAELTGGVTGVSDATAVGNTSDVLARTSQDVNPSPAVGVVDQGTTEENGQTKQAENRDATQEAARTETTTETKATITIKIPRPGSGGGGAAKIGRINRVGRGGR